MAQHIIGFTVKQNDKDGDRGDLHTVDEARQYVESMLPKDIDYKGVSITQSTASNEPQYNVAVEVKDDSDKQQLLGALASFNDQLIEGLREVTPEQATQTQEASPPSFNPNSYINRNRGRGIS